MPLGTSHSEKGLLLKENGQPVLQRDAGGRWRLEAGPELDGWLGRRVIVRGVRTGFDLLLVEDIAQA
jgi:hypothetical protein